LAGVGSGTLLAVGGAGAYGFVMSSQYNSRPRGAEVVVDGDRWAVAREREPVQDLWRGEPAELAWHESS
jgi:diaminopimelate decarboxylase